MIRKMTLFIATALMISMIALTASAQRGQQLEGKKANETKIIAEKKGAKLPASLEIVSVTKDNKAAKKNPNGAGILVPVDIRWKLPQGARLVQMEATLKTSNTDKSTASVNKVLPIEEARIGVQKGSVLMLPMPDGVFAQEFTLTLNARMVMPGDNTTQKVTQTKSGKFPAVVEQ